MANKCNICWRGRRKKAELRACLLRVAVVRLPQHVATHTHTCAHASGKEFWLCIMFKRARLINDGSEHGAFEDPAVLALKAEAGKQLRTFLLEKYCLDGLPASTVATIAYWCTKAGGLGVQDLAVHPSQAVKHGSEHIKNAAGKIYPEPNLTRVFTPMYVKRETRRVEQDIPVYLPSQAFKDYVDDLAAQTWPNMPRLVGDIGIYKNHPVVVQAELENNQITVRPIALYWDGVQYTNHDSFMGFYVTNILSGQKFLSFLVRPLDAFK